MPRKNSKASGDGARGPFLRMRARLWLDRDFRTLSHSAAGLYFRLHSFLDDQENDGPTGWQFTAGEMSLVGSMARGGSKDAELLAELVKGGFVEDLHGGAFRLTDVQGGTHEVREARKVEWRAEKKRQRDAQVSGAESEGDSERGSSRAEAEAAPLPRHSGGMPPLHPPTR